MREAYCFINPDERTVKAVEETIVMFLPDGVPELVHRLGSVEEALNFYYDIEERVTRTKTLHMNIGPQFARKSTTEKIVELSRYRKSR